MDCKDILRMSYVCESAEDTEALFNALTTETEDFSVYAVKNGFSNYVEGE